jgi:cytochrome c biogenesis protein CcdA
MNVFDFLWLMGRDQIPIVAAFFMGIMAAINPCTLATNITATAFIADSARTDRDASLSGCIYTLGRTVTYIAVASGIILLGLNVQFIALALQHYGGKLLGPFLVICGLYMLLSPGRVRSRGMDRFSGFLAKLSVRLAEKGYAGSFLIGVIFALSFCPISAVIFFTLLIPLSIKVSDPVVIPTVFAIATSR